MMGDFLIFSILLAMRVDFLLFSFFQIKFEEFVKESMAGAGFLLNDRDQEKSFPQPQMIV